MAVATHATFECPICAQVQGPFSRAITFHARKHAMTTEQYWLLVHRMKVAPTCGCRPGCDAELTFYGWEKGYFRRFVQGHLSEEIRLQNGQKTSKKLQVEHWSRGKTKETDARINEASAKKSVTMKRRYALGELKQWSQGLTKETSASIANMANSMRGSKRRFYDASRVEVMLLDKLQDRFDLLTNSIDIENRANNRTCMVTIRCTRCNVERSLSIMNVIRKDKQRCDACDPIMNWISRGELEMVEVLHEMFGHVDVQVRINGWSIDAYVPSIETYFQFDGIYWHGLDRPIDENTNVKIVRKHARDKAQIVWFASQGVKLVRITEVEWTDAVNKRALIEEKFSKDQGADDL